MDDLQNNEQLERSDIVANNRMNRERQASGSNGYETDLGLNPIEFVTTIAETRTGQMPNWLDLCCGRGRAIIETAKTLSNLPGIENAYFLGIDLVGMFDPIPDAKEYVSLEAASLHTWDTTLRFDLITCSHGLHYIGDKLDLIDRSISWLRNGGRFVANLDLENLGLINCEDHQEYFLELFKNSGFDYCENDRLLQFQLSNDQAFRRGQLIEALRYIGADDQSGPNYTGQEAVKSFYEVRTCEADSKKPS